MSRPKSPWDKETHLRLKKLWDQRIAPTGMSQKEFGERFGIGSQAMVSQYLLGTRPLNYDAAEKFALGFSCTIAEVSPEMAERLARDFFPKLGVMLPRGRLRRRAASVILASAALAAILHNHFSEADASSISALNPSRILIACRRVIQKLLGRHLNSETATAMVPA